MRAIEQIQERADRAGDHVAKLCTKEDRWRMSVPPRSTDSDVLLTQLTDHDVPAMAHALKAVLDLHVMYWDGARQEYVCRACQHPARWPTNTCPTVQPIYEHLGEQYAR